MCAIGHVGHILMCLSGCLQATFFQHLKNVGSHVRKLLLLLVTTIGIVADIISTTTVLFTVSVVLTLVLVLVAVVTVFMVIVIVTNIVCLHEGSLSQLDVARFTQPS